MARSQRWRRILAISLVGALASAFAAAGAASAETESDASDLIEQKVDPDLLSAIDAEGEAELWVRFQGTPEYNPAFSADAKADKGTAAVEAARRFAESSQADLTAALEEIDVAYESYWSSSTVKVRGGLDLLETIVAFDEVSAVVTAPEIELIEPVELDVEPAVTEWGLDDIHAPKVWDELGATGEGVVVANIDTGVDYDHPALVEQYRGNDGDGTFTHDYNFLDVQGVCEGEPCDLDGHGTHTMGTMVGDDGGVNQIGVAPGAEWIAVNGCCPSIEALLQAGEWIAAPTDSDGENPDPTKAPDIVNNSWGTTIPSDNPFYEDIVALWHAAGIIPVFSNGNNGPSCDTSGSPGLYPNVIGVGAYDIEGVIAGFSSRGPGRDGQVKPDVSAPGVNVRSSFPGGVYGAISGTSMAAPHVAGTIALMMQAAPELRGDFDAVYELITGTARYTADDQCGGTDEANNVYGHGRIDAFEAVSSSIGSPEISVDPSELWLSVPRGGSHTEMLTVTNTGAGSAEIDLTVGDGGFSVLGLEDPSDTSWLGFSTDSLVLAPGESADVEVIVTATEENGVDQPGTYTATITLEFVGPGEKPSIPVNVVVTPLPDEGKVFGNVEALTCEGDTIALTDAEIEVLTSDAEAWNLLSDAFGSYELWVQEGDTSLTAAKEGYETESAEVEVLPGNNHRVDFELEELGC